MVVCAVKKRTPAELAVFIKQEQGRMRDCALANGRSSELQMLAWLWLVHLREPQKDPSADESALRQVAQDLWQWTRRQPGWMTYDAGRLVEMATGIVNVKGADAWMSGVPKRLTGWLAGLVTPVVARPRPVVKKVAAPLPEPVIVPEPVNISEQEVCWLWDVVAFIKVELDAHAFEAADLAVRAHQVYRILAWVWQVRLKRSVPGLLALVQAARCDGLPLEPYPPGRIQSMVSGLSDQPRAQLWLAEFAGRFNRWLDDRGASEAQPFIFIERVAFGVQKNAKGELEPLMRGSLAQAEFIIRWRVWFEASDITVTDVRSQRRTADVVKVRQEAVWLVKMTTLRSLPEIGRNFGGRDHTTVLHAVRKIDGLCAEDAAYKARMDGMKARVEFLLENPLPVVSMAVGPSARVNSSSGAAAPE